jgi:probable HAF family extracellular repeat protein
MLVLALSGLSPLPVGASADAPAYTITDLGTLGGPSSSANAISGNGLVVGTADNEVPASRAFLWQEGIGMTDLGEIPGLVRPVPSAKGVNDSGWVIADVHHSAAEFAGLFRDGEWRLLPAAARRTSAVGINNSGQIVGTADPGPLRSRALLYEDGEWTDLGTLPGDLWSAGGAINGSGEVVGSSGNRSGSRVFLWQKDLGMVELGSPGAGHVFVSALTEDGRLAGTFGPWESSRPFVYRDSEFLELGTLPGDDSAGATGMNLSGLVVGTSRRGSGDQHPFLWHEELGMVDLNEVIPPNSGWELISAAAINDTGQIVGTGRIGGQTHAFILDPTTRFRPGR